MFGEYAPWKKKAIIALTRVSIKKMKRRFLMKSIFKSFFAGATLLGMLSGIVTANETNTGNKTSTATSAAPAPAPHCEVPCGIYSDQMRFEMMLEDANTIAKSIASVKEISDGFSAGPPDAKTINQMTRWINTKETHATNTQHIIAQYFMTQRIKADSEGYTKQLAAAHKVMVSAMKCKQDADPATAETLKKAIYDLYRAYEGKEPTFHKEEKK